MPASPNMSPAARLAVEAYRATQRRAALIARRARQRPPLSAKRGLAR